MKRYLAFALCPTMDPGVRAWTKLRVRARNLKDARRVAEHWFHIVVRERIEVHVGPPCDRPTERVEWGPTGRERVGLRNPGRDRWSRSRLHRCLPARRPLFSLREGGF